MGRWREDNHQECHFGKIGDIKINLTIIVNMQRRAAMKKRILGLVIGCLLIGFNGFAADGDLIVNGNVGIGTTTSPNRPLHLYGSNTGVGIQDSNTNGHEYVLTNYVSGDGSLGLYDQTAGAFRWLVNSSGNIGIGTTSPTRPLTLFRDGAGAYYNIRQYWDTNAPPAVWGTGQEVAYLLRVLLEPVIIYLPLTVEDGMDPRFNLLTE
jgi:hypothetical protein